MTALFRYPVKSMSGVRLDTADLGWHGIDGDRRLGLHRPGDHGGFPWLTATRLPELLLFAPQWQSAHGTDGIPTHVRTPEREDLAMFSRELASAIGRRHGSPVEMMHLDRGIFDEASISIITSSTVDALAALVGQSPDVRRFRPNVLITSPRSLPFEEDEWVGGVLSFGRPTEAAVGITNRDERCSMVNLDPDSARPSAEMLKAIVRARGNKAGVYGTVTRRGHLAVGQPVYLEPAAGNRPPSPGSGRGHESRD